MPYQPVVNKSKNDKDRMRLRRLTGSITKTNRLLTGDRAIEVKIVGDMESLNQAGAVVPGYTNYPNIFINADQFELFRDKKFLVQLLGLNYHELSHIIYSPRNATIFFDGSPGIARAYNILEDQRIESFFTARYKPAGKYFTEMVVRFMVDDQNTWESAFLFTYGRSFLPMEIRQEFESRFVAPELVDEAKKIIDDYKKLKSDDFVYHVQKVKNTIRRFHILLNKVEAQTGKQTKDACGAPDPRDGSPMKEEEEQDQKADRKRKLKEDRTGEDQSDFWDDEEDDEDSDEEESNEGSEESEDQGEEESVSEDSTGSDSDGDSEDQEGSEEDGEGDGDDSDPDSGGDGESSEEESSEEGSDGEVDGDTEGESASGDTDAESAFSNSEFQDYLDDIADAVNEDEVVQNDVENIVNAMNDQGNIDIIDFGEAKSEPRTPTPEAVMTLGKVTQEFRRLYAEVEPGWRYGSDNGKLNVGRAISDPYNYDEMFDEWDEGLEHESGMEVVLSLDISGSMGGMAIHAASEAMWIIKRALDDVNAKTTVLGFHRETLGLISRDEEIDRSSFPLWGDLGGSTDPGLSFKLARRIFENTPMPNKLFICITDGQWSEWDDELKQKVSLGAYIRDIDATKMYVEIGGYPNSKMNAVNKSLFDTTARVTRVEVGSSQILVDLVQAAVTKMLNVRRRR